MAEFAPPTGPPPPKVPEGWKAVWNDQYSEWFYVDIYTKKSQWEKPTEPTYPPGEKPDGPPPSYAPPDSGNPTPAEKGKLASNNPYAGGASHTPDISEDEKLARQLQEEENARAGGQHVGPHGTESRGAADDFYNHQGSASAQPGQYGYSPGPQSQIPYPQQQQQQQQYGDTQDKGKSKGGFLGKLLGKTSPRPPQQNYRYPPPQQGGYGQPVPGGYYSGQQPGYYPQQGGMYGQPARKKPGMGVGTAAALGVGGGLLGGAMLAEAADAGDHGGNVYEENNYYGDDGGDGGDGFGDDGGDFGGGDFGGD